MSESWAARIFFGLTAIAFVGWGISGDLTSMLLSQPNWVAKVGDQTIEVPAFQQEFQRAVAAASSKLGQGEEISADQRREIGQQTLDRMIGRAVMAAEVEKLRVVVPDQVLVGTVQAMPAFKGKSGQFDRATFETIVRNNGYTEDRFLAGLREELAQQQILSAADSTVAAPDTEVTPLYKTEFEKRTADMAFFPISAAPAVPPPDAAVLQRYYDNHMSMYATPEYRKIKAVELSPESLASEITVTDADLQAYYNEHKADYETEAKRSAEVVSVSDEAKAKALADQWNGGADWAAMQKAAQADGGSAITQDDATAVEFPDPDLAKAVFAADADKVTGPVKGALGWFVVKVTKTSGGSTTSFDQAKDEIRKRVIAGKAADRLYDRANKLDQLLGNGSSLDDLPGDLGLVGVTGTLDADGLTQDGSQAPIPGPPELRSAMIKDAFVAQPNDQPHLVEVQTPSNGASSYYALVVESVTPPGTKPYAAVKDQVLADWTDDQKRRAENVAATAMMVAVQGGQSFSDAATVANVQPHMSPALTRSSTDPSMPASLLHVLFGLKLHDTTMVETIDGFVVAQLVEIQEPDPAADAAGYDRAKAAVARSIGGDVGELLAQALRQQANPRINQQNFDSIVRSP
jgi:peptidyl-prolyl cis-trans isomerase D